MHTILIGRALVAGVLASVSTLAAQERPTAAGPVSAAMYFHMGVLEDPTPFDACSIHKATGQSPRFPENLLEGVRGALDRQADPCEGRGAGLDRTHPERIVLVDSVQLQEDAATVFVTVWKGENRYNQDFRVRRSGENWHVQEVRTWGAVREYAVRRRVPHGVMQ